MKIKKLNESVNFPTKEGWYWVLLIGDDSPTPCWFMYVDDGGCFLPGGMGDESMGLYEEDVDKVGPEIIEPNFN